MAMSVFFFKAATIDVTSSGSDVAMATNVSPITDSEIPISLEIVKAPETIHLPPKNKPEHPDIINTMDLKCGSVRILLSLLTFRLPLLENRTYSIIRKNINNIIPSVLSIIFSCFPNSSSLARMATNNIAIRLIHESLLQTILSTLIGYMIAVIPIINNVFIILLPKTLPITSPELPFKLAKNIYYQFRKRGAECNNC